jgi:two-component system response regulator NreC
VISVVLVDDHAVVRSGIRLLLDGQDDIEVVGEAGNAKGRPVSRSSLAGRHASDVVMPGESGTMSAEALQESPETKVPGPMQDDPLRAGGVRGGSPWLRLKEAVDEEVVSAVREIAQGNRYVHPTLGARMVTADAEERAAAEADPLSEREREVLRLLALGHTNQEIAQQLYISVRTAESHRAHIMQKLHLATRAELVRYALSQGLLAEDAG